MNGTLKNLSNLMGSVRHTVALVIIVLAAVVSFTLHHAQVGATQEKTKENAEKIKVITDSLHRLNIQQRVIINQIEDEKEDSKEFRDRADKSLDRILDKLNAFRGERPQ